MLELRRTFSGTVRVKLARESDGEELGWSTAVTASGESLMSFLERMSSDEARSAVADAAEVVTADYESALTRFYECFEDFLDGKRAAALICVANVSSLNNDAAVRPQGACLLRIFHGASTLLLDSEQDRPTLAARQCGHPCEQLVHRAAEREPAVAQARRRHRPPG